MSLRSTVSGSGYASAATGIASTSYTNTGLTNGTTYYFVVSAANASGTSGNSNQASATPSGTVTLPLQINTAGPAVSPFIADAYFSGGTTAGVSNTINTSAVTNPAPQAVYQTERYGPMTYTIPGLTSGNSYTVRLHFSENWFTGSGLRKFNVAINGTSVLANFDIFATAGAQFKANIQQFTTTANTSGQIVIAFTNGAADNAKIDGIEVLTAGGGSSLLSQGKPATASSVQDGSGTYNASNAFDGNTATRWGSVNGIDPQWIYVDLGAAKTITEVKLNWEAACGKDYLIQASNDASTWTTIKTVTGNTASGVLDYTGLSGSGRYVRMYGTARATQWGYSLWEMQVYGL